MTGQDILDRIELVNQELQLQSGEADVTRGLLAVNVAQDYFEALLALHPGMMLDTTGTVVTAASTETTAFPTGVLRIDRIQYILPSTSRPSGPDLANLGYVGVHTQFSAGLPGFVLTAGGTGIPSAYWTNGRLIYWQPLPAAVHTFRWYGLSAASTLTAGGTFAYPDTAGFPLAVFAAKIMSMGVGDSVVDLQGLAEDLFQPLIQGMKQFNQDRAAGYDYSVLHTE